MCAEGARRKPNLSGKRTETLAKFCAEQSFSGCSFLFTEIRRTMSEYNKLVCEVGSEPKSELLGGINLKIESRVNA